MSFTILFFQDIPKNKYIIGHNYDNFIKNPKILDQNVLFFKII